MSRRVQYTSNGDIDQLHLAEVPVPDVGPGQVLVTVLYAGLNPLDWKMLQGGRFGTVESASGNGVDFSGVVASVGEGVADFAPGDLVYGGLPKQAQTEQLLIPDPAERLDKIPHGLGIDTAGGLYVAGRTAVAGIRALGLSEGDTLFVSGASGGVGIIVAQLARNLGARVIGSASPGNHALLDSLGVEPVTYGEGLWDRVRALAPNGVQAAYSTQGEDEITGMLDFGIPAGRIVSIGAGPTVAETYGVSIAGEAKARRDDMVWLGQAIAYGHIHVPIARVFDADEVQDAYRHLLTAHPAGKVLLRFPAKPLTDQQRAHLS
ncbi:NADP-dependent oxidoreductase [Brevibacterium spongiae]|uniref:NADP-dependent oxidoreductase n=1 Tax=Brevibacterium spongiae TaxID=2909672 RepID=A0ABY5SR25_9MICO|nr:NADP-dependent oxidoreductase [Brevibacterium spongiae]UVI36983.1 NADP-dependent oxidoreductase [Brevibacterium spongiae]